MENKEVSSQSSQDFLARVAKNQEIAFGTEALINFYLQRS
jgi:hypothetical protein